MVGQERVAVERSERGGRNQPVWLEQKSLIWMKELLAKFSTERAAGDAPGFWTLLVAKLCLMLPKC